MPRMTARCTRCFESTASCSAPCGCSIHTLHVSNTHGRLGRVEAAHHLQLGVQLKCSPFQPAVMMQHLMVGTKSQTHRNKLATCERNALTGSHGSAHCKRSMTPNSNAA